MAIMKDTVHIDSAGRLVIPKELRKRYGFESGNRVRLVAGAEGVTLVPDIPRRRFIKRGPILTIDTGAGTGTENDFSITAMREEHLKEKENEDRG